MCWSRLRTRVWTGSMISCWMTMTSMRRRDASVSSFITQMMLTSARTNCLALKTAIELADTLKRQIWNNISKSLTSKGSLWEITRISDSMNFQSRPMERTIRAIYHWMETRLRGVRPATCAMIAKVCKFKSRFQKSMASECLLPWTSHNIRMESKFIRIISESMQTLISVTTILCKKNLGQPIRRQTYRTKKVVTVP